MYLRQEGCVMFSLFRRRGTIIADGLKIVGSVTAEGLVEVNGHIEGDLHCSSLVVSSKASLIGGIEADHVVVNGRVEGPIRGGEVLLKSRAYVVGDIEHSSLAVEKGAYFDGRSVRTPDSNVRKAPAEKPEKLTARLRREQGINGREPASVSAA
jgi:cytoskeletal protein CcmA (bactofilin family)